MRSATTKSSTSKQCRTVDTEKQKRQALSKIKSVKQACTAKVLEHGQDSGFSTIAHDRVAQLKNNCCDCSVVLHPLTSDPVVQLKENVSEVQDINCIQLQRTDSFGNILVSKMSEQIKCQEKREKFLHKIASLSFQEIQDLHIDMAASFIGNEQHDGDMVTYGPEPINVSLQNEYIDNKCLVLKGGSQRGGEVLLDNECYQYSLRSAKPSKCGQVEYRCRKLRSTCPARILVASNGEVTFKKTGEYQHRHLPCFKNKAHALFLRELKKVAVRDPYTSAGILSMDLQCKLDEFLADFAEMGTSSHCASAARLRRIVWNQRRKFAPPRIRSGAELLLPQHFPGGDDRFLIFDIHVTGGYGKGRFIGLATELQLRYLFFAKTWFLDATFRCVVKPFLQLLCFHVVFDNGISSVSVPVMFVIMSQRRKVNYLAIFNRVLDLLQVRFHAKPFVTRIIVDFEYAIWQCLRQIRDEERFREGFEVKGCLFHFCQAVYRRVIKFHLDHYYINDSKIRFIIKMLMALPLLPLEDILQQFQELRVDILKSTKANSLLSLYDYMYRVWMNSNRWGPADICQYRQSHKTNNVSEAYNAKIRLQIVAHKTQFYELVNHLWKQVQNVPTALIPYAEPEVSLCRVKKHKGQRFLEILWIKLDYGFMTVRDFLEKISTCASVVVDPFYASQESRIDLREPSEISEES